MYIYFWVVDILKIEVKFIYKTMHGTSFDFHHLFIGEEDKGFECEKEIQD